MRILSRYFLFSLPLSIAVAISRTGLPVGNTESICKDFLVPVKISYTRILLDITINDDWDAVEYIFNSTRRDSVTAFQPIVGSSNVTAQYKIAATFCSPKAAGKNSQTALVLTHGSMEARDYWDPTFKGSDPYNFVQHFLKAGYSVFFYDRIGNGQSSRPDPVTEVQFNPQVDILTELTRLVKKSGSPYTLGIDINKVVYVGHSFGSFIVLSAATSNPVGFVDGIILSGFSGVFNWLGLFTSGGQARVAALAQPSKWGDLAPGYLTPADLYALSYGGFKSPYFDHDVAISLFDAQNPFAIGELLSASAAVLDFSLIQVPVQVIEGRYDLTACGGNCDGVLNQTVFLFPNSKSIEVNGSFNAGHFLNFHYDAPKAYNLIASFLESNNL